MTKWCAVAGTLATIALLFASRPSIAQSRVPGGTDAGKGAESSLSDAAKKRAAKKRYDKGLKLTDKRDWENARAEFDASRALYPTGTATANSAACLRALGRDVEAYELYGEALSERFANSLDPPERKAANEAQTQLWTFLAEIDVRGVPGATVVVDGLQRGTVPLTRRLLVRAGNHMLRVWKEGFHPFEEALTLVGKEVRPVNVTLKAVVRAGTLRVQEETGRVLDVLVDDAKVGLTPFTGMLPPGKHKVMLTGKDRVGSAPATADIRVGETTTLVLRATTLDAVVRIEATPLSARVLVDGTEVGTGVWQGALRSGRHRVVVSAPDYTPDRREINLAKGGSLTLRIPLERTRQLYAEPFLGFGFARSFGGGAELACSATVVAPNGRELEGCRDRERPRGFMGGARVGLQLVQGLGVELGAGYVTMVATTWRNAIATTEPTSRWRPLFSNAMEDRTTLAMPFLAASASYRFLRRTPVVLRLWTGVARGRVTTSTRGTYTSAYYEDAQHSQRVGSATFPNLSVAEASQDVWMGLSGPEARIGYSLGRKLTIDFGVLLLLGLLEKTPRTNDNQFRATAQRRTGVFPAAVVQGTPTRSETFSLPKEDALGTTLVLIAPTFGARWTF
ncbi:MAG TPA: PEGA domain-containing protein [Polyangiaceae bacterium]|nr:PEGA domain-containing protein [Polyangiaceae bacterium]HKY36554.1 PEGA domain-containing protein [Polyangiaceae bacterium]